MGEVLEIKLVPIGSPLDDVEPTVIDSETATLLVIDGTSMRPISVAPIQSEIIDTSSLFQTTFGVSEVVLGIEAGPFV